MDEYRNILKLHNQLLKADYHYFPPKGNGIHVSTEQGVYIIYSPSEKVLHVGRTLSGKYGLNQRLRNHLGKNGSSFTIIYLSNNGDQLREGYKFKFIEVVDPRKRALLEALTAGMLCPEHIGIGNKNEK